VPPRNSEDARKLLRSSVPLLDTWIMRKIRRSYGQLEKPSVVAAPTPATGEPFTDSFRRPHCGGELQANPLNANSVHRLLTSRPHRGYADELPFIVGPLVHRLLTSRPYCSEKTRPVLYSTTWIHRLLEVGLLTAPKPRDAIRLRWLANRFLTSRPHCGPDENLQELWIEQVYRLLSSRPHCG
jgi:hypothetical protein